MNKEAKSKLFQYVGDISQVFYAKTYRFEGGKADGMRAVDISNGTGLSFTVYLDRAMDIGHLSYKGYNTSFISKCGVSSAKGFDGKGLGWLKTFTAGFLTTCGLTQVGSPCVSDGEELGLHGVITSIPAEEVSVNVNLDCEIPEIIIKGKMRQAVIFGENIWLTREIKVLYGKNRIYINDTVENRGDSTRPYMILYHFNMGYPLLDENVEITTSAEYLRPRDEEAKKGEATRTCSQIPVAGYSEQVFYYKSKAVDDKGSYAGIYNKKLGFGVKIWSKPDQLPNLVHWKNMGYGDYVMGLEPGNCFPEGREKQKEVGLETLEPMETAVQNLVVEIVE